jgi:hypothetical protein
VESELLGDEYIQGRVQQEVNKNWLTTVKIDEKFTRESRIQYSSPESSNSLKIATVLLKMTLPVKVIACSKIFVSTPRYPKHIFGTRNDSLVSKTTPRCRKKNSPISETIPRCIPNL